MYVRKERKKVTNKKENFKEVLHQKKIAMT